jgi:hypothetical protein
MHKILEKLEIYFLKLLKNGKVFKAFMENTKKPFAEIEIKIYTM